MSFASLMACHLVWVIKYWIRCVPARAGAEKGHTATKMPLSLTPACQRPWLQPAASVNPPKEVQPSSSRHLSLTIPGLKPSLV